MRSNSKAQKQAQKRQISDNDSEVDLEEYYSPAKEQINSQLSLKSLEEVQVAETKQERRQLTVKEDERKNLAKQLHQQVSTTIEKNPQKMTQQDRLNVLLQSTEIFTNFMLQRRDPASKTKSKDFEKLQQQALKQARAGVREARASMAAATSKKGRKRGAKAEEVNDEDEDDLVLTRLTEQPKILTPEHRLRDYQLDSLNWMIGLYETGINGILADEMGLGKTIQTISFIAFLREYKQIKGKHLIIAPKTVISNWRLEFEKWLPEVKVCNLIATKEQREEIIKETVGPGKFDVILTSFEGVRLCMNALRKFKWEYIIVDEAHKLKNEDSQVSKRLRELESHYRLLLTGTPLQNNLHELWALLNFLLPDVFASSDDFDEWFDLGGQNAAKKAIANGEDISMQVTETDEEKEKKNKSIIDQLHKILRPFMLRRIKKEVEKSLPPKIEMHISVGITEQQKQIYRDLLKQSKLEKGSSVTFYKNILIQLRKVCNHPYLFPGQEPDNAPELGEHLISSSGKMIFVDKLVKRSIADKNQILIFSGFTTMLDILEDFCNFKEICYCRLDGSTDLQERERQIAEFVAPDSPINVFLISTRAGGLGLNLMTANIVVLFDSDWNPQIDLQAMDRAHRIGQTKVVQVFRLVTQDTMEEKMIERQTLKLKLDTMIIQKGRLAPKNTGFQKDEMQDMLNYGADAIFTVGNSFSDRDIDALIEEGERKALNLQKKAAETIGEKFNMTDFEMNTINIYEFEDEDFVKSRREAEALKMQDYVMQMVTGDVEPRKRRTTQQSYKESEIVTKIFVGKTGGISQETLRKRLQVVQDYRFFPQPERLKELIEKEINAKYSAYFSGIEKVNFTEEDQIEKDLLMRSGFRDWDRRDFQKFIQALEIFPREDIEAIAKHVGNKSEQQVKAYQDRFYENFHTLTEYTKIQKNLEKAEKGHSFKRQAPNLIRQKVTAYERPVEEMVLAVAQKSKYFSRESDIVLLCLTHEHGYGNWTKIKQAIRRDTRCRFDHLFMSRSEQDLQRRLDILVKALEKEQSDKTRSINQKSPQDVNLDIEMASDGEDLDEEQKDDMESGDEGEEQYQVNLGGGLNAESGDQSQGENDEYAERASSEGYDALCGQKRSYNQSGIDEDEYGYGQEANPEQD